MYVVPRIHDALEIRPAPRAADGTCYVLVDGEGKARLRVDEAGRFLLLQLDGLRTLEEVGDRFRERFDRALSNTGFTQIANRLSEIGLLVREDRGLRALRYLRERGIRYRGIERDRRRSLRPGDLRRDDTDLRSLNFDRAVYLINEGLLEAALESLEDLASAGTVDLRVQSLIEHLRFLVASETRPDLRFDRRDVEWAVFDRALNELLASGRCPRCDASIVMELGAVNRCDLCGASFSGYLMARAARRRGD